MKKWQDNVLNLFWVYVVWWKCLKNHIFDPSITRAHLIEVGTNKFQQWYHSYRIEIFGTIHNERLEYNPWTLVKDYKFNYSNITFIEKKTFLKQVVYIQGGISILKIPHVLWHHFQYKNTIKSCNRHADVFLRLMYRILMNGLILKSGR